jgi:hypothetical protein
MGLSPYDKKVIKGFTKWRKEQTKELRERRSVAVRRFLQKVREGVDPIIAKQEIGGACNFTPKQMENIITGRSLLTKDGAQDRQVMIERIIQRAERQIDMISDELQHSLEDIDQAERDGVDLYELEYEDQSGGKNGDTFKTKGITLDEARFTLRNRYMDQLKKFTSMIRDLVPDYVFQTNVYNVNQQDVENEVMALIKKNRLSDDTFKEKV